MADYVTEVLADTPRGYWRLEETSGTAAADSSGNALNGTYVATPTLGVTGAATGQPSNKAVTLASASSQRVDVADNNLIDLGDVFTIEACILRATIGAIMGIVGKGTNAYLLRLTAANNLQLVKTNAANVVSSTNTITSTVAWQHVAVTKNGPTVNLYHQGVDVTGVVTNATFADTALALSIGADQSGGTPANYFNGSIDEVAVYATALSATRIAAHYNALATAPAGSVRMLACAGAGT